MTAFELDRGMVDFEAHTQLTAHRSEKSIISFRLRFYQMNGESGFGRTQWPNMQMMKIGDPR